MSLMSVNIHGTSNLTATAKCSQGSAWVVLQSGDNPRAEICIFIEGDNVEAKANRLADAINGALADPVEAEAPAHDI